MEDKNTMSLRRAVFLDRDGTLIEDRGFLREPSEVCLIPGVLESLRLLSERYLLFIVTNQTGVGEGVLKAEEVDTVNRHLLEVFATHGVHFADVYVCPHKRSDDCVCIKPKPHFLEQAAKDYAVDLAASFAVGDHPHDVEFATNVGAGGIYVLTGHGARHQRELPDGVKVLADIGEAAQWILSLDPSVGDGSRA